MYSLSHLGWHFRIALSKLKAQSSNVSFHWNLAKETFEVWALRFGTTFENVTPRAIGCVTYIIFRTSFMLYIYESFVYNISRICIRCRIWIICATLTPYYIASLSQGLCVCVCDRQGLCVCVCDRVCARACTYFCVYVCVYTPVRLCVCVCVCVSVCVYCCTFAKGACETWLMYIYVLI